MFRELESGAAVDALEGVVAVALVVGNADASDALAVEASLIVLAAVRLAGESGAGVVAGADGIAVAGWRLWSADEWQALLFVGATDFAALAGSDQIVRASVVRAAEELAVLAGKLLRLTHPLGARAVDAHLVGVAVGATGDGETVSGAELHGFAILAAGDRFWLAGPGNALRCVSGLRAALVGSAWSGGKSAAACVACVNAALARVAALRGTLANVERAAACGAVIHVGAMGIRGALDAQALRSTERLPRGAILFPLARPFAASVEAEVTLGAVAGGNTFDAFAAFPVADAVRAVCIGTAG